MLGNMFRVSCSTVCRFNPRLHCRQIRHVTSEDTLCLCSCGPTANIKFLLFLLRSFRHLLSMTPKPKPELRLSTPSGSWSLSWSLCISCFLRSKAQSMSPTDLSLSQGASSAFATLLCLVVCGHDPVRSARHLLCDSGNPPIYFVL